MSISIKSIQIHRIGPLNQFQQELGKLNLIFGLNETGKTYLVEFLLRSLFRPSKRWDLRNTTAQGSVDISGLEQGIVRFSPGSNRKLEDYWQEVESGLPANLSRLLVVKGGELALTSGARGGISREVLKNALTSQAILDALWDAIQPTVRNAEIKEGQIHGKNMGKLKDRNQLLEEISSLTRLLNQIEKNYSRGPARQLEMQLEKIQSDLDRQGLAKRHLAYQLWKEIQDLKAKASLLSEDALTRQRDQIRDYRKAQSDLKSLEKRYRNFNHESQGYSWLEAAIETWEEKGLDVKTKPPRGIGVASIICLVAGLVFLNLEFYIRPGNLFWVGTVLSGLGLGLIIFYFGGLLNWANRVDKSRERENIINQFHEKFDYLPGSLTDLREKRNKLQESFLQAQSTKDLINEKNNHLELESQRINTAFRQLTGENIDPPDWQSKIKELIDQFQDYNDRITELNIRLTKLNVDEGAFREDPAESNFDPERFTALEREKAALEDELSMIRGELETLKARACERTGDDISTPWPDVYFHFRNKLKAQETEYQRLTAQIVAEIGLTDVLIRLREAEDQKIVKALNNPEVTNLIGKITGKYHRLDLDDDQLYAFDDYSQYPLHNLSTGAREQILLALRLGIASQVCAGERLFLILDDAFQHSDWQRRTALVESTVQLVNEGWQVLYLSMDEHIRDLFQSIAAPALKKDYLQIDLT